LPFLGICVNEDYLALLTGGTGQFAGATGSFPVGTATARGLGARDPDGSCSMTKPLLHEVDLLASSGTLSF